MLDIREYVDEQGKSRFRAWRERLDAGSDARIASFLARLEQGNTSNVKSVGGGVLELRMDFGPGYRAYFGRDGDTLVLLLGGGTKRDQSTDIARAKFDWQQYKRRKAAGDL